MATKPKANPMRKPKTPSTRTPKTRGNDRDSTYWAKSGTAMKLMDKAFENGKPKAGTSVTSRIVDKSAAWDLLRQGSKALKESGQIKKAGERMARMQAAAKAKRGK